MSRHEFLPRWVRRRKISWVSSQYYSITCEIHGQIGDLRRKKFTPKCIRLGPAASARFAREHWAQSIEEGPKEYLGLPVLYRDPKLSGVFVEHEEPE
ncbi:MAG: hypothetical protein M1548_08520 [Actinobacteria bacterium]|nr:hypothetical protein [Actinomycetota bacterium]